MLYRYLREPHPHLLIEEIVDPTVYAGMTFPDELVSPTSAWGITRSDPAFETVLEDPAWKALYDELTGEAFICEVLGQFAEDMRRAGCLVDPDRAQLGSFVESRDEKSATVLTSDADPNDLFTRLDFQSKGRGEYRDFVHLDWARRIVGAILFFSDTDEDGLVGGELAFYRDRAFRNDRWCHDPELTALFPPRHNTGVIFLNSNSGFHGPRKIEALAGRRRWLYYTISAQVDVWPHASRTETTPAADLARA
jgi:hypothetical protein